MLGPTSGASEVEESSWHAHEGLATLVRVLAFVLPFGASVVMVRLVGHILYRPPGWDGLAFWVLQAAPIGATVSILVERATRKALPLATLLNLSMVFPDQAPSRFSVALRAGSVRNLERRLDEIRATGLGASPDEAAATALELVTVLSSHDRLTRGHAERVRAYADLIADEMGLKSADRLRLSWGVLLHDIGKLAVPAEILNKSEKLSAEEWELLQGHPAAGAVLLEPLAGWLGDWLSATGDHHERWDGGGYPNGLAGSEISLAGRIAAVADAYDVITSRRSYREPLSPEAARKELVECAGTQFDPEVVRSFLAVSLGRRWTFGPLAWLSDLPIGQIGTTVIYTPALAVTGAVLAVAGMAVAPAEPAPELLALEVASTEVEQSTTTLEAVTAQSFDVTTSVPAPGLELSTTTDSSTSTTVASGDGTSTTGGSSTTGKTSTSTTVPTTTTTVPTTTTTVPTTTTTVPTTTTTTAQTTTSIPGGIAYGSSIYVAGTIGLSWHDAVAEAQAMGGHLVTISSEGENNFIKNTFGTDGAVWVALSDHVNEGTFRWSNGESVAFTKWMPGEPSDFGSGQDFAAMVTADGSWDDVGDDEPEIWVDDEWVVGDVAVMTVIEFDS